MRPEGAGLAGACMWIGCAVDRAGSRLQAHCQQPLRVAVRRGDCYFPESVPRRGGVFSSAMLVSSACSLRGSATGLRKPGSFFCRIAIGPAVDGELSPPLSRAPLQPPPSPASKTAGSHHPRPPRTAPRTAQLAPDTSQLSPPAARAFDANGRLPRARGPQAHRWTDRFMPKRCASRVEKANGARWRKEPPAGEEVASSSSSSGNAPNPMDVVLGARPHPTCRKSFCPVKPQPIPREEASHATAPPRGHRPALGPAAVSELGCGGRAGGERERGAQLRSPLEQLLLPLLRTQRIPKLAR